MCPVYVPAVSVPVAAEICKAFGAVPLAGVTESHAESLLAVKLSEPPPVFVTFTEAGVGFAPPCVALKDSARELTASEGGVDAAATLNVAVIVAGDPCTPEEATVIWPV
jgi:hypothetical protein